jgi:hypothetical protein
MREAQYRIVNGDLAAYLEWQQALQSGRITVGWR